MYAGLAVATGIPPSTLMQEEDEMICTMLAIMEDQAESHG